ncbi:hypothetical protein SAMN05444157_2556 [Frankineae bacterium MT45]|nr:hypothetical protein SAMN05444157_2556 [Frankineae bacterium MT45]
MMLGAGIAAQLNWGGFSMRRSFSLRQIITVGLTVGISTAVLQTSPAAAAAAVSGPTVDQCASAISRSTVSVQVHPAQRELAVAYVAADDTSSGQTATVSSPGATWHFIGRSNGQRGDAEAWFTWTSSATLQVSATAHQAGSGIALTVQTYRDASGIGAWGATSAPSGAPSIGIIPNSTGSKIYGVGMDWDHAQRRTLSNGQVLDSQYLDTAQDTYWVQHASASTSVGSPATISDLGPTQDQWNLIAIEILPPPSGTCTTASRTVKDNSGVTQTLTVKACTSATAVISTTATSSYTPAPPPSWHTLPITDYRSYLGETAFKPGLDIGFYSGVSYDYFNSDLGIIEPAYLVLNADVEPNGVIEFNQLTGG